METADKIKESKFIHFKKLNHNCKNPHPETSQQLHIETVIITRLVNKQAELLPKKKKGLN